VKMGCLSLLAALWQSGKMKHYTLSLARRADAILEILRRSQETSPLPSSKWLNGILTTIAPVPCQSP